MNSPDNNLANIPRQLDWENILIIVKWYFYDEALPQ